MNLSFRTKLLLIVGSVSILFLSIFGVERIDAGHVGVKVNMYGDGKLPQYQTGSGSNFYLPIK
jgi:hypothetical protein